MDHISYVAYIYTFGFIVPVTIIFTSYYKIIKTVKYKVSLGIVRNGPCDFSVTPVPIGLGF